MIIHTFQDHLHHHIAQELSEAVRPKIPTPFPATPLPNTTIKHISIAHTQDHPPNLVNPSQDLLKPILAPFQKDFLPAEPCIDQLLTHLVAMNGILQTTPEDDTQRPPEPMSPSTSTSTVSSPSYSPSQNTSTHSDSDKSTSNQSTMSTTSDSVYPSVTMRPC